MKGLKSIAIFIFIIILYGIIRKTTNVNVQFIDKRDSRISIDDKNYFYCFKQFNVVGFLNRVSVADSVLKQIKYEQELKQKRCSLTFLDNTWWDLAYQEDEFPHTKQKREDLTFLSVFFDSYSEKNAIYEIRFKEVQQFDYDDYVIIYKPNYAVITLTETNSLDLLILNKFNSLLSSDKEKSKRFQYSYFLYGSDNNKLIEFQYTEYGKYVHIM